MLNQSNHTKPLVEAVKPSAKTEEEEVVKPSPPSQVEPKPAVIQKIPPKGEKETHSNKTKGGFLLRSIYATGHNLSNADLCPELGARLRLLIVITSAPDHAAARMAVRQTWGHFGQRKDVSSFTLTITRYILAFIVSLFNYNLKGKFWYLAFGF